MLSLSPSFPKQPPVASTTESYSSGFKVQDRWFFFLQIATSCDSNEHQHQEMILTLLSGQPPKREGAWLPLKLRRKLAISYTPGKCSREWIIVQQGREAHYMVTRNSRFCWCILSGNEHSEDILRALTWAPTLGRHWYRVLAGLRQGRVAKFEALTNMEVVWGPLEHCTLGKLRLTRSESAYLSPQKQRSQLNIVD